MLGLRLSQPVHPHISVVEATWRNRRISSLSPRFSEDLMNAPAVGAGLGACGPGLSVHDKWTSVHWSCNSWGFTVGRGNNANNR